MDQYYYIPGQSPYEKLKIIDSHDNQLSYKAFRKKHKESLSILNFNYPSELLKRGISSAAILSFHRLNNSLLVAQTMICGKDQSDRNIPITKILILENNFDEQTLLKGLKNGKPQINYPDYRNFIPQKDIGNRFYRKHKDINKVQDWFFEQKKAFEIIVGQILENSQVRSGKSLVFNKKEKSVYNTYIFFSKKKASKYLAYSITVLLIIILAVTLIYLNT